MKRMKRLLIVLGLILLPSVSLLAATSTWDGDTDSFWTTALNWDTAPAGGEDIVFPSVVNQTVDLAGGTYSIAALNFNSPNPYAVANSTLTLGGTLTQSGAGAITLNSTTDLGGASRTFGGAGTGLVTLGGPVTDAASSSSSLLIGGGNYVIGNPANSFYHLQVTGGKATVAGTSWMAKYDASTPSYFGLRRAIVNGGVLDYQVTTPPYRSANGGSGAFVSAAANTDIAGTNVLGIWNFHALEFGPNGGTLLMNKYPVDAGPTYWYSSAGVGGTVICGQPTPYMNQYSTNYNGPWDIVSDTGLGLWLGPSTAPNMGGSVIEPYMRRMGEGDLTIILTNGATAYLDWAEMTNGWLHIKGVANGNSACKETNSLGQTTTDAGRLMMRAPHRATGANQAPLGAAWPGLNYQRAFAMNEGYGMKFYDHLQVCVRENFEYFACDMTFEPGASVDFSGRNARGDYSQRGPMLLGWPANAGTLRYDGGSANAILGRTNNITIKGGAKLNLNLQMRTMGFEDNVIATNGANVGVHVFSPIKIEAGGELKIYRSLADDGGSYGVIELYRPITGAGNASADARVVVNLPWASGKNYGFPAQNTSDKGNGVNFDGVASRTDSSALPDFPGAQLVVNGSSRYGLRLEGDNTYLDNLLGIAGKDKMKNRLESLSGTGGVLTIAADNTSGQMTMSSGPTNGNPGLIRLGLVGSLGHTYVVAPGTITNFNGLLVKAARVKLGNGLDMTGKNLRVGDDGAAEVVLDDSATATIGQLVLIGDTALEMGTAGGSPAVLNLANSTSAAWTASKTLTIKNWNGSTSGGGPDQIKFGTDATGLTPGQLAQIKWIAPNGGTDVTGAQILSSGEIVPVQTSGTSSFVASSIVPPNPATSTPFSVTVSGVAGATYTVKATSNLGLPFSSWQTVGLGAGPSFTFTDPGSLTNSTRFYKIVSP